MVTKYELLNAPTMEREDADRVYSRLYIIPTDVVSKIDMYPRIIFVAGYFDGQNQERYVRFDNVSEALMLDNRLNALIRYFFIDCSYEGVVRLYNLGHGFTVEQTNGTFIINPA